MQKQTNAERTEPKKEVLVEKILFLETNSEYYSFFRNMYLTLGRFCNKILYFNRRDYYLKYGKDKMNQMLLELIKKEQPDYVFTWLTWDEFYIDTLLKINEISPHTKTVVILGDDTIQFYDFSRYYALLFNYVFTTLKSYQKKYKEDGIKNVFFTSLTDAVSFHPIETEKKYDVTFIGSQKLDKSGRYEYIKYLKDNGINVRVFGFGWENFNDLKDIYGGALESGEVLKVINQTKINLCFSKDNFGRPQMKAKIFETGACKAFTLCEYAPDYESYFTEGKDIIMFKNKEDLLKKVQYYLKNTKEREKIASASFKKVTKEYSLNNEIKNFILKTRNDSPRLLLPKIEGKVFTITEKDILFAEDKLRKITENYDYITFKKRNSQNLPYKNYFQIYSIQKSKKPISCCNYYVYSRALGDYLLFFARDAMNLLDKKDYQKLFDLDQLMMTGDFFLQNLDRIKRVFAGEPIDFVNKETTGFVAIPLVRIKKIKTRDYNILKKAFGFKFMYRLYSLVHQKKILLSSFPYFLVLSSLNKGFIIRSLVDALKDKDLKAKIKKSN